MTRSSEDYIEKYCTTREVTRDVALSHLLVKTIVDDYEKRGENEEKILLSTEEQKCGC